MKHYIVKPRQVKTKQDKTRQVKPRRDDSDEVEQDKVRRGVGLFGSLGYHKTSYIPVIGFWLEGLKLMGVKLDFNSISAKFKVMGFI